MFRKILQMDTDDLNLSIEKQLPKLLNIAFKFVNNSEISNCGFQIIEIISYHQGKSFNITNGNAITKICISFLSHPLHYKQAARVLAHLSIYDNSDYFMNTWNAFSCELVHLLHALGIFNMSTLKSKQIIDSMWSDTELGGDIWNGRLSTKLLEGLLPISATHKIAHVHFTVLAIWN
jgi:hypothetical protein